MDQRTRKLMTMHKALNPRDDINRLYVSRKEGGRELASIEDTTTQRLHRKTQRRNDYSHQKWYWQYDGQQNNDNEETKMGRKTTLCPF